MNGKLPHLENAIIAEEKITGYLLSETQEDGRHKAAFFMRFGFSLAEWEELAGALRQHVADNEVASVLQTPHGEHYAVEGPLQTPTDETPLVRTVWALDTDSTTPRLITAYPLRPGKEQEDD